MNFIMLCLPMVRFFSFTLISFLSVFLYGGVQPKPWQIGFQEANAPLMEEITKVHNLVFIILCIIGITVTILLIAVIYKFRESKNPKPSTTEHHTVLEIIWTVIPVLLLIVILIPSIKILYVFDKAENPDMTIKVTGHQWYWSYEYLNDDDSKKISFDSYMIKDEDLKPGQLRLLDVDKPVVLPKGKTVRILITSQDVIHSFAVPALGIKTDGIPGRTNETWLRVEKEGMYYGQCSELCGKDHGFMPIALKIVSQEEYNQWVNSNTKQK
ncbi:MAG: cytochrome c oxidase subunit II [Proteobacteria bacterium]|nr:cytochrome c oxidase subunit II [Pseudomonadota bacterium]